MEQTLELCQQIQARAEDQRNEVRLAFGVVWFRS
jgi:hypothetical protein